MKMYGAYGLQCGYRPMDPASSFSCSAHCHWPSISEAAYNRTAKSNNILVVILQYFIVCTVTMSSLGIKNGRPVFVAHGCGPLSPLLPGLALL